MDEFVNKLIYLGGNLGIKDTANPSYVDLEEFVVSASNYLGNESRVTTCFITWLKRYSSILSPSKLRRILSKTEYNPYVFSGILSIIEECSKRKQAWGILKAFAKKHKERVPLFSHLPTPKTPSSHFLKGNIVVYEIVASDSKFLKDKAYVLKHCPEIRYRAEGQSQVISDLRAYLSKTKFNTLYEIAKYTNNPRNRINESFRFLEALGTLGGVES